MHPSLPGPEPIWETWLAGLDAIPVLDGASLTLVREALRACAAAVALPATATDALAIVASELGQNQLRHARQGAIAVRPVYYDGHDGRDSGALVPGVEIVAADRGPGLSDPTRAFLGGEVPDPGRRSLGAGLSGAHRLADELDIDVRIGEGSCFCARKFAAPPERRSEIAILGRACPGEELSGDSARFVRGPYGLAVAIADGLGKGVPARAAAEAALAHVERAEADPAQVLAEADADLRALRGRGAVMSVVRLERPGALTHAGAGDISCLLQGRQQARRFLSTARVLGQAPPRPCASERAAAQPDDLLVLHTDGLLSRLTFPEDPGLRLQHPLLLCHHLLAHCSRGHDDALVLICRI